MPSGSVRPATPAWCSTTAISVTAKASRRQLLYIGMQLADWAAAMAYAQTPGAIDQKRIGLWGTFFSGGT